MQFKPKASVIKPNLARLFNKMFSSGCKESRANAAGSSCARLRVEGEIPE